MFARSFARVVKNRNTVRKMGGDHHHAPAAPQGGLEGAVRKILPQDHHLALGIMGFYFTLYTLVKIWPSKKKAPVAAVAAPAASASGDIPSVDSAEFGDWIAAPGNIEKLLA